MIVMLQKSMHRQIRASRHTVMVERPIPGIPLCMSISAHFPTDAVRCQCSNVGLQFLWNKFTKHNYLNVKERQKTVSKLTWNSIYL